jgi:y4mF family transcriptional regulator
MAITSAAEFGALIRQKRKALGLTQEELATRCGVGPRFIVDLEAGKPSCQLGKALTAAVEVGLRLDDAPSARAPGADASPTDDDDPLSQIPSF